MNGMGGGKELGLAELWKTIIRTYYMKNSIFKKRKKINWHTLELIESVSACTASAFV